MSGSKPMDAGSGDEILYSMIQSRVLWLRSGTRSGGRGVKSWAEIKVLGYRHCVTRGWEA